MSEEVSSHFIVGESLTARTFQSANLLRKQQLDEVLAHIQKDMERLDEAVELSKYGPKQRPHFHNTIFIHGPRGSGKTTLLLNIENAFKKEAKNKTRNGCNCWKNAKAVRILEPMDPTLYEDHHNFLFAILAHLDAQRQGDGASFSSKLDTLLFNARALLNDSKQLSSEETLSNARSESELENHVWAYLDEYCKEEKIDLIYLPIDDNDMAPDGSFHVLETLRRYLTSPRIVPIVTGDFSLYRIHIQNRMLEFLSDERHEAFLDVANRLSQRARASRSLALPEQTQEFLLEEIDDTTDQMLDSRRIHRETSEAFLSKVLPEYRRIILPPLSELGQDSSSDVLHFSYTREQQPIALKRTLAHVARALYWGEKDESNADAYADQFLRNSSLRALMFILETAQPGLKFFFDAVSEGMDEAQVVRTFRQSDRFIALIKSVLPMAQVSAARSPNGERVDALLERLDAFFAHENLATALLANQNEPVPDDSPSGFVLQVKENSKTSQSTLAPLARILAGRRRTSRLSLFSAIENLVREDEEDLDLNNTASYWSFLETVEEEQGTTYCRVYAYPTEHKSSFDFGEKGTRVKPRKKLKTLNKIRLPEYRLLSPQRVSDLFDAIKATQGTFNTASVRGYMTVDTLLGQSSRIGNFFLQLSQLLHEKPNSDNREDILQDALNHMLGNRKGSLSDIEIRPLLPISYQILKTALLTFCNEWDKTYLGSEFSPGLNIETLNAAFLRAFKDINAIDLPSDAQQMLATAIGELSSRHTEYLYILASEGANLAVREIEALFGVAPNDLTNFIRDAREVQNL